MIKRSMVLLLDIPGPGSGLITSFSYHAKKWKICFTHSVCALVDMWGGCCFRRTFALVTNGMSEYQRDGNNANSALLVGGHPG